MPIPGILASSFQASLPAFQGDFWALNSVTVPSGGVSSITFTGIPQNYTNLQIRAFGTANTSTEIGLRFNGDSTSNYYSQRIVGIGSGTPYGDGASAGTSMNFVVYTFNSTYPSSVVIDLLDYSNTIKNKTGRLLGGWDANGSGQIAFAASVWNKQYAINSITILPTSGSSFSQYSQFDLYGVK